MYFGTDQTLKIKLAGAKATNDCAWAALAIDTSNVATPSVGNSNGTADVTVIAATKGCLKWFWLQNADTAAITISFIFDNNSTQYIFAKVTLQIGDNLVVNSMGQFQVLSSAGVLKDGGGIGGTAGATDNRVVRADGTGGSTVQAGVDVVIDDSARLGIGLSGTLDRALQLGADCAARGAVKALTDGATITPDAAQGNFFSVTLGGNRTLDIPANLQPGQSFCIWITQDGTGGRTLAYHACWDFKDGAAPTLSTGIGAVDCLVGAAQSTTHITAHLITGIA